MVLGTLSALLQATPTKQSRHTSKSVFERTITFWEKCCSLQTIPQSSKRSIELRAHKEVTIGVAME